MALKLEVANFNLGISHRLLNASSVFPRNLKHNNIIILYAVCLQNVNKRNVHVLVSFDVGPLPVSLTVSIDVLYSLPSVHFLFCLVHPSAGDWGNHSPSLSYMSILYYSFTVSMSLLSCQVNDNINKSRCKYVIVGYKRIEGVSYQLA